MKFLDKVALTIFSDVILILSIIACVLIFGWLDFETVSNLVQKAITTELPSQIILGCSVVFILLSIYSIFFSSSDKQEVYGNGVLLENEKGKLMISSETLQNLANEVAMKFDGTEDVVTKVSIDKENNLIISVNLTVKPTVVIKELSANIQDRIKTVIKQTTDLDVKEVNIKVKNIAPKQTETNK